MSRRLFIILVFTLSSVLLTACQSPCQRPPRDGYTRFIPSAEGFELGFDYPAEWSMKPDRSLEKSDSSGEGLSLLVEFDQAPVEHFPNIYREGNIVTEQEWGSPFPGRAMQIEARELSVDGRPALTVTYDFDAALILMDGTSPVTSWGSMQFTFIVVDDVMYQMRLHASTDGEEAIREEFDRLVNSICIYTGASSD
jgi:hypothetical protein